MAIIYVDPENWQAANAVQVDSDASDHEKALCEIEDWAAEHGFARTTEYRLRRLRRRDGTRVFRGFCYRLTEEVLESARSDNRRISEAVERQPTTSPSGRV
jgi:hypothetical protein